MAEKLQFI